MYLEQVTIFIWFSFAIKSHWNYDCFQLMIVPMVVWNFLPQGVEECRHLNSWSSNLTLGQYLTVMGNLPPLLVCGFCGTWWNQPRIYRPCAICSEFQHAPTVESYDLQCNSESFFQPLEWLWDWDFHRFKVIVHVFKSTLWTSLNYFYFTPGNSLPE